MGNPGAFSYSHVLWVKGFLDGLGSPHYYSAGSQDVNNRFAASALLYGSPLVVPIPDLKRTDFLLMVGANPLVSHGSVLSAPRVREQLNAIVERGGRVVVVDPRRTETARQYEHLPIRPDADAWLLLSMLQRDLRGGPRRRARSSRAGPTESSSWRAQAAAVHARAHRAERTGVPAERVREIARAFAAAGERGCLRAHRVLPRPLRHAGRLPARRAQRGHRQPRPARRRGLRPAADRARRRSARRPGLATYGKIRSRIGGFPDVIGNLPATLLPREITTPGERPDPRVLRVRRQPGAVGARRRRARERARAARPDGLARLLRERDQPPRRLRAAGDHLPRARGRAGRASWASSRTPFIQVTEAVVPPRGEARQEWRVIDDLSRRIGVAPYSLLGAAHGWRGSACGSRRAG